RVAIVESQGSINVVSDEEILAAQQWLAKYEGIFVEPASAASIAGFFKCCDSSDSSCSFHEIPEGSRIVCTVTGHGLKDPDVIIRQLSELKPVAATANDVRRAIELYRPAAVSSEVENGAAGGDATKAGRAAGEGEGR